MTTKEKVEIKPLEEEQVELAYTIINENHPLAETPLTDVYPIFKLCKSCFKKKDDVDENEPLLKALKKDEPLQRRKSKMNPSAINETDPDPFNSFGFGIVAYRQIIFAFMVLYCILTIIMLPALVFYHEGTGIVGGYDYSTWSLGNLGYSSSQCTQIPLGAGDTDSLVNLPITCSFGAYTLATNYGINKQGLLPNDYCKVVDGVNSDCSGYLNATYIEEMLASSDDSAVQSVLVEVDRTSMFSTDVTVPDDCSSDQANFFLQYQCTQTDDQLATKYSQLSLVSACGIFVCFVFLVYIYYIKRASKLKYLAWDMETVTVGDYSVEYEIRPEAFDCFLERHYTDDKISTGMALKNYMKKEFEKILTDLLKQKKDDPYFDSAAIKIEEVKIADIVFAFNNADLIHLLRERGKYIVNQKYEDMRKVEQKITDLKNNPEKFQQFIRPVCAFITFEEEDSYIIAQELEPTFTWSGKPNPSEIKFLDMDLYLKEATEPNNIIWENRHFTRKQKAQRTVIAIIGIFLVVLVSFLVISACKSFSTGISSDYDFSTSECAIIENAYGSEYETYAFTEYNNATLSEDYQMTGVLQCYCDGVGNFYSGYTYDSATYTDPDTGEEVQLCYSYTIDLIYANVLSNVVTGMVVVINMVLRAVIIIAIDYIGLPTESDRMEKILKGIFITQFFNTGLLLLLCNANFDIQGPIFSIFSFGTMSDFNDQWFDEIGYNIVYAMLYLLCWPVMEFFAYWGMRYGFRLLDRSFGCDIHKTKKTTLQQYVELYSGPTFVIHYKYSYILLFTFVPFIYGFGLPLLFPVSAGAFAVFFLVEKSMLYYSYRMPPMYDDKLNKGVLSLMTWAPLFMLSFGFWMISNKQLVSNDSLIPFERSSDTVDTGHRWTEVFTSEAYVNNPAEPILLTLWFLLIFTIFRNPIWAYLMRKINWLKVGELELDEDLPNYFKCLDDHDRDWSIKEEENIKDVMHFDLINEETFKNFKNAKSGQRLIQGTHTYDILANILYTDDFQYFSAALPERKKYIIDDDDDEDNDMAQSDLVRMVLNLGFLTEKQAREFSFDKAAYMNQRKKTFVTNLKNMLIQNK